MTPPEEMNAILADMKPEEIRDALWMVSVFERWNMPAEEADEWRRRIVAWGSIFGSESIIGTRETARWFSWASDRKNRSGG